MRVKRNWSDVLNSISEINDKEKKDELVNDSIREHRNDILLCPTIVKPLYGVAPRAIMGEENWNKTRTKSYADNKFHCLSCGVHKSKAKFFKHLEAHELYEIDYVEKKYVLKEIVPLCHACHSFIHSTRTKAMLDCGKMTLEKYNIIMQHGKDVLLEVGLNKEDIVLPKEHYPEIHGGWGLWYLEYEGTKHFSMYKNEEECDEFYRKKNEEN